MEIRRFFVSPHDITTSGEIVVTGDEFLHMTKVLRYKVGYKVLVCANDGIERLCTIKEIGKDYARLLVDEQRSVDKQSVHITLYAGLLKNNKIDFAIPKAVELGVDKVRPFLSHNTAETKFSQDRASKIALEAAKQCGSAYLTEVEPLCDFKDVIEECKNFDTVLFAYEFEKKNRIKDCDLQGKSIALIVGAEGGFTEDEAKAAKDCGAQIVTLGRRILRAETASIVASTLLLDALGELDYE